MKNIVWILIALVFAGCDDSNNTTADFCKDVDCGEHGTCGVVNDVARCFCDNGYIDDGTTCIAQNNSPEITSLPAVEQGIAGQSDSFHVIATDPDAGDTISYSVSGNTCSFTPVVDDTGVVTWTCDGVESCTVDIIATDDGSPILSDLKPLTIMCVNSVPTFTSVPATSVNEGDIYTYDISCTDEQGESLTLSTGMAHSCAGSFTDNGDGTGFFSFIANELQGGSSCTLHFTCSDSESTESQFELVNITELNFAPVIENLPESVSLNKNNNGFFTVNGTDDDLPAQLLEYSIISEDCAGFDPSVTTNGQLTWSCNGVEDCSVEVAVSDGTESATGFLYISCINTIPVIDSTAETIAYALDPYDYEVTCSDSDNDALTISIGSSDTCGGILTDNGDTTAQYIFTPADNEAGSCTIDVLCTDLTDTVHQITDINIKEKPETWVVKGSLNVRRGYHTATLLSDGRVLVTGGMNSSSSYLWSAEIYDPVTEAWTVTGSMNFSRAYHTATLLSDGRVLVAGGYNSNIGSLFRVEIFDPATETWTLTGSMNFSRAYHTATLLSDGRVLVAGGFDGSYLSTTEIFDPATETWTVIGSMNSSRGFHKTALLSDGRVLAAGGVDGSNRLSSVEIFDPATETWTLTGSMNSARIQHTATLLSDGRVLVAGGFDGSYLSSVEIFDPATETWTVIGSMNSSRGYLTATLLSDGRVLAAGGFGLSSAELYDPATENWTLTGSMNSSRVFHTATLLSDGRVLAAGGMSGSSYLSSAEHYNPPLP